MQKVVPMINALADARLSVLALELRRAHIGEQRFIDSRSLYVTLNCASTHRHPRRLLTVRRHVPQPFAICQRYTTSQ